jgi:hypothetical protein
MKRGQVDNSDKGKEEQDESGQHNSNDDDSDVFGLLMAEQDDDDDYHVAQDLTRRSRRARKVVHDSEEGDEDNEECDDEDVMDGPEFVEKAAADMVEQEVRHQFANFDWMEWEKCSAADFVQFRRLPYPLPGQPIGFGNCKCFADFFLCFFPLSFWSDAYLCTVRNQMEAQKDVFKNRKLITWREFFTCLGVLIYIGLHSIRGDKMDLWSMDPLLGAPVIGQQISRNRFKLFWQFLRVSNYGELGLSEADIVAREVVDPFFKMRPMLDEFLRSSLRHWQGAGCLAEDELVVRCGARTKNRRNVRAKPIPRGMVFNAVGNSSSGYLLGMLGERETVKMEQILERAVADASIPITQEMVDALSPVRRHYAAVLLMCLPGISELYPWRGNLSMDNLFNSPVFASFVSALRLTTNGTMRYASFHSSYVYFYFYFYFLFCFSFLLFVLLTHVDRMNFCPKQARALLNACKVGSEDKLIAIFRSSFQVPGVRGHLRDVPMYLSKMVGSGQKASGFYMLTTGPRFRFAVINEGEKETERFKPVFDHQMDYNKTKGGVDLGDQFAQYYEITMRSQKWTRSLFVALLNRGICQATVAYRGWNALYEEDGDEKKIEESKKLRVELIRWCFNGDIPMPDKVLRFLAAQGEEAFPPEDEEGPRRASFGLRTSKSLREATECVRYDGRHYPDVDPNYEVERCNPRECVACKNARTTFWCPVCLVPLCVVGCFKAYHEVARPVYKQ